MGRTVKYTIALSACTSRANLLYVYVYDVSILHLKLDPISSSGSLEIDSWLQICLPTQVSRNHEHIQYRKTSS